MNLNSPFFPKKTLLLFLFLIPLFLWSQKTPTTKATPAWVEGVEVDLKVSLDAEETYGGAEYLLLDQQLHLERQTEYTRVVKKIVAMALFATAPAVPLCLKPWTS